jgi:hypothetical protein
MKTMHQFLHNSKLQLTFAIFLLIFALNQNVLAQPWTYDFGTGTGSFNTAATINTTFINSVSPTPAGGGTYMVRTASSGNQGTGFVMANPGTSLGTGTELQINASATASTNKFTVYGWSNPANVAYLKFKLRSTNSVSGNGVYAIHLGNGSAGTIYQDGNNYVSYNNSITTLLVTYASGSISTVQNRINGSYQTITGSGITKDADQEFEIYANNSVNSVTYSRSGTNTLGAGTWDLWLGGTKLSPSGGFATAGTMATGTALNGFGFFAESSTGNTEFIYLDDLEYSNNLPTIAYIDDYAYDSRTSGNWGTASTWIKKLNGSVTFTNLNAAVTGVGTAFTQELAPGDILMLQATSGTVRGTVLSITDDRNLTLTAGASGSGSGAYGKQATPNSSSGVISILGTHTVTVAADVTADQVNMISTSALTINPSVTLTIANGPGNDLSENNGSINVNGNLVISSGANFGGGGGNGATTGALNINSGGIVTVNGTIDQLTQAVSIVVTVASGGTMNISSTGNVTTNRGSSGTSISITGTVHVTNGGVISVSGSGNTLTVNSGGVLEMESATFVSGSVFTLATGGTLRIASPAGILSSTANGNVQTSTRNYGVGGNYDYNGTATQFTGSGLPTLAITGNVIISNTAGVTPTNNIIVNTPGSLIVNGLLTPTSSQVMSGTGTLTGTGTVQVTETANATNNFTTQYTHTTKTLTNLTVEFKGAAAQKSNTASYGSLKINNSNGLTIGANTTVTGTLTFTLGNITTGANKVIIASTGSVSGAGSGTGWVAGNLQKNVAVSGGPILRTFEIGGTTGYRPVVVEFASVGTAGDLTAGVSQSAGDHPQIGTSTLDANKSVNRYWTLTNSGIVFSTYDATFNFLAGDIDGPADTNDFLIGRYDGVWDYPSFTDPDPTSIKATGVSAFGDFAIAELACVSPTVDTDPTNQSICSNSFGSFNAAFSGGFPAPVINWQVQTGGVGAFNDLSEIAPYSGTGTGTLTITNPSISLSGNVYRLKANNECGDVFTAGATLTVNDTAHVDTNPVNGTACSNGSTTLTASFTGGLPAPDLLWQVQTGGIGAFADLSDDAIYSGTATGSLLITNPPTSLDGNVYRLKASNICGDVFTTGASLTVRDTASVDVNPANESVCSNGSTFFTASFTGGSPVPTLLWQVQTGGIGAFNDLVETAPYSGTTTGTLTITDPAFSLNGNVYRLKASNICGDVFTSGATLTVNDTAVVDTDPVQTFICSNASDSFTASFTGGSPAPDLVWQVQAGGAGPFVDLTESAPYSGTTTGTLLITNPSTSLSGNVYRLKASNLCGDVFTDTASLVVYDLPVTDVNPEDTITCTSGSATFTASFTGGNPAPALIWQVQTGGVGAFADLTETAPYSGTATNTLTITNPSLSLDSNVYRLKASNLCGDVFSESAILSVLPDVGTETVTACDSYFWPLSGDTYTESGAYPFIINNGSCDVTITLNLTINLSSSSVTNLKVCDEFLWNGTLYTRSGSYNYLTVNSVGCDSLATLNLYITSSAITSPDTIIGPLEACPYANTLLEATYYIDKVPTATSYVWSVPNFAIITSHPAGTGANDTIITVKYNNNPATNNKLSVIAVAPCGQSLPTSIQINREFVTTPVEIFGITNVCEYMQSVSNPTGTAVTYYINSVPGATSYSWVAPVNATISNHPNGSGVNDTIVEIIFNSSFVNGYVYVSAVNGCGTSAQRPLFVRRLIPATPGAISGPAGGCALIGGGMVTYSINPVLNATSYEWTLPAGIVPVAPSTGTSIDVTFDNTFAGGSITVKAKSNCFTSAARSLSISGTLPNIPGTITTTPVVTTCPNKQYTYSISGLPAHATQVEWTIPPGSIMVSPQGSLSMTVLYPATGSPIVGTVSVAGKNGCGYGPSRSVNVNLTACPLSFVSNTPDKTVQPGTVTSGNGTDKLSPVLETINARLYPNPSLNHFRLHVNSSRLAEKIEVFIFDVQGKIYSKHFMQPGETIEFGNDLKAGAYIIEVRQGVKTEKMKAIKF